MAEFYTPQIHYLSNMLHQEFEAPESLQDSIKCFWYDRRELGKQQTPFEVIPDGYAEIIFHFGNGCCMSRHGELQPLPSPFMIGLLDQPVVFHASGRFQIIGIRCFPWTVFDLLCMPPEPGVQQFEHPIAGLHLTLEKLIHAGKANEAIQEVKQYLIHARQKVAVDSMLSKAGIAMRKANGSLPVSQVAASAHVTVRTLERNFKQSSGRTVKDVSALIRFEQVRNRLWSDPGSGLAALAYELGYADQSHMSREFRRYSGTTPSAFARNAKQGKKGLSNGPMALVKT